ncbi:MAG: FtsX-like permease family protein [Actinomycetota bacterium]
MLRTTLAATWSHKRRLCATGSAVLLGVAFLSATLVFGDSARAGFAIAFAEANAGTDAYVRSAESFTAAEEVVRPPIAAEVVDVVAALDGVATVAAAVSGTGQVLDAQGRTIGGNGPPTMAAAWAPEPAFTGWALVEGRPPAAPGEVVLDRATAAEAGAGPGSKVTVLVPRPVEATVVGIATFGGRDSLGGSTYAAFTLDEAQRLLLGGTDLVSGVVVAAAPGVDQDELVRRLAAVLPPGVEAVSGADLTREQQAEIEGDFLGFFTAALTAFAVVALLVAAFSIFNTFAILAAQRTGESALLRALGASRRQVLGSALAESAIVGLVGSVLGAGAGVLVAAGALSLMEGAGFGMPVEGVALSARSLALAVAAGLLVTLVGGALPAWRAGRVSPLAALRDVAVDTSGRSRSRAAAGTVVVAGGAAAVVAGASGGASLAQTGLGAVVVVAGMVLLGPVVARPVGAVLGAPLRWRGASGDLARRNAVRNPRRMAASATALLVGVGVVSLFTVFGASVARTIEDQVDRAFGGDLALTPAGSGFSGAGLSPELVAEVAALAEVEAAAGLGFGPATVGGRQQQVGYSDPAALAAVADFDLVEGDVVGVSDDGVAMSADFAADHGYRVGQAVDVGFADGSTVALTLVATYDQRAIGGDVLVTDRRWAAHNRQPNYFLALVTLAEGTALDAGRAAVEAVAARHGSPDVMDRDGFVASQAAQIDTLLTVVYALLAVAVLIALMGIANTLSLSVHERRRELGLLRAVGQSRPQMRAMVRWESVIVALFGAVGGLALGLFVSWGLVMALNEAEGFGTYAVPAGSLVTVLAVGAAAGVAAGLRPAWRAARLDVLEAVASP